VSARGKDSLRFLLFVYVKNNAKEINQGKHGNEKDNLVQKPARERNALSDTNINQIPKRGDDHWKLRG
jgi:hypothetical protein